MKTLISIIMMFTCIVFDMSANATSPYEHIEIENISYRYQIVERLDFFSEPYLVTKGTLELSICIPPDVTMVIVAYTWPFCEEHISDFYDFKAGYMIPEGVFNINASIDNVYMGAAFIVIANFKDGHHEFTQRYEINSYIKEEDLELIRNQSKIDEAVSDDVSVAMRNNCIIVEPQGETALDIVRPDGIIIYSGQVSERTEIPIDSELVIVRYKTKDKTITKKLVTK